MIPLGDTIARLAHRHGVPPTMSTERDPFRRFGEVWEQAAATGVDYPDAMVLSTVNDQGQPSSRVVLLKEWGESGFVFYTNLESRKGQDLAHNDRVSLNFYWRELGQQVIVRGRAQRVDDETADAYFASRDRGSRLGAWASRQSRPMTGRAQLLAEVAKVEAKYLGRQVPRPPHWSGMRVVPHYIEFWVEGRFRLHDRTAYELEETAGEARWRSYKKFP